MHETWTQRGRFKSSGNRRLRQFSYKFDGGPDAYWRTSNQVEVDFILDQAVAIEVKSASHVTAKDLSGLIRLKEENALKKYFLVYTGDHVRRLAVDEEIEVIPYRLFLERLWSGKILD